MLFLPTTFLCPTSAPDSFSLSTDSAPTHTYTLSLHDALPISRPTFHTGTPLYLKKSKALFPAPFAHHSHLTTCIKKDALLPGHLCSFEPCRLAYLKSGNRRAALSPSFGFSVLLSRSQGDLYRCTFFGDFNT